VPLGHVEFCAAQDTRGTEEFVDGVSVSEKVPARQATQVRSVVDVAKKA